MHFSQSKNARLLNFCCSNVVAYVDFVNAVCFAVVISVVVPSIVAALEGVDVVIIAAVVVKVILVVIANEVVSGAGVVVVGAVAHISKRSLNENWLLFCYFSWLLHPIVLSPLSLPSISR